MSREIKFRAWDGEYKKWVDFPFFIRNDGTLAHQETTIEHGHFHVYQYTGLKDKNGKEIYEGDVLRDEHGNHLEVDDAILGQFVYFNYHEMGEDYVSKETEIIGNIYENPELTTQR